MAEYDRERAARLFDNLAATKGAADEQAAGSGESIRQMVGRVAFERLALKDEDVLLDVGTGTGDRAIAAAGICRQVVGIDISRKSLEEARRRASRKGLSNAIFAYSALEEPSADLDLTPYDITKILAVYSLHHLPDPLKKKSLSALTNLLSRPGRIVIGDLMFFEDPDRHRDEFHKVRYDGGNTDFPSHADYLIDSLVKLGGNVRVDQIHPLAGVLTADFP